MEHVPSTTRSYLENEWNMALENGICALHDNDEGVRRNHNTARRDHANLVPPTPVARDQERACDDS